MPRILRGRDIGERCNVCHGEARLVPLTRVQHNDVGKRGGRVYPITHVIIGLACDSCGIQYVSAQEGQDIESLMHPLLDKFTNPSVKPQRCACGGEFMMSHRYSLGELQFGLGHVPDRFELGTDFLYCPRTLKVLWVEPTVR